MTYAAALEIRSECGLLATSSKSRSWHGVTVYATEMHWLGGQGWHDVTPTAPSLSITLEEVGGRYEHRTRLDQPPRPRPAGPPTMSLTPAGMQLWGYANNVRFVRVVSLTFDMKTLSAALGNRCAPNVMDRPHLMFCHDRLAQFGALLAAECVQSAGCDTLYGESLVVALCVDLFQLGEPPKRDKARGGLASWQVRRLTEYIEAHLPDAIHLKDLADLTELSVSHFGRAFRKSFGIPPHRWHLNARIRRAQELLLIGALPLADVALRTGFADQSHFTRNFGRQVGISPGVWRREHRR